MSNVDKSNKSAANIGDTLTYIHQCEIVYVLYTYMYCIHINVCRPRQSDTSSKLLSPTNPVRLTDSTFLKNERGDMVDSI